VQLKADWTWQYTSTLPALRYSSTDIQDIRATYSRHSFNTMLGNTGGLSIHTMPGITDALDIQSAITFRLYNASGGNSSGVFDCAAGYCQ
jgi:hypothetical protein